MIRSFQVIRESLECVEADTQGFKISDQRLQIEIEDLRIGH